MSERAHARPHELYFNTASSTVTHRGWLVVYDTCPISSCFPAGLCRSCCCWPTHEIIGQEQWWRAQLPGVLAADWTSRKQAWGLQPIVCPHTPCCTCTCLTDLSVCHKLREICQMENTLKFVLTVFFLSVLSLLVLLIKWWTVTVYCWAISHVWKHGAGRWSQSNTCPHRSPRLLWTRPWVSALRK